MGEYWERAVAPNEDKWGFCLKAPEGYYGPHTKAVGLAGLTKCLDGFSTEEPGAVAQSQCKGIKDNPHWVQSKFLLLVSAGHLCDLSDFFYANPKFSNSFGDFV